VNKLRLFMYTPTNKKS